MSPRRVGLIDSTVNRLVSGQSAWVVGPPGSGKTHRVTAVLGELAARDIPHVHLRGVQAWRDRPFGALLAAAPDVADAGAAQLPARCLGWLQQRVSPATVLVIDDFDNVDSSTLGAIAARATAERPRYLVTSTQGRGREARRAAIELEYLGAQIRIPPLHHEDLHQLLESRIGPGVDHRLVSRLLIASGGLAGLSLAVAREAQLQGTISQGPNGWTIDEPLWHPHLNGYLDALMAGLDLSALDALNDLALLGPVGLDWAMRLTDPRTLNRLEAHGLIEIYHAEDAPVVILQPPLLAAALRGGAYATVPSALSARVAELTVAEDETPPPRIDPQQHRSGSWGGSAVALAQVVRARRTASGRAERYAWECDPTPENALAHVRTLHELGAGWEEMGGVWSATRIDPGTPAGASLFAFRSYAAAATGGHAAQVRTLLDAAAQHPAFASYFRGVAAHSIINTGVRPPDDLVAPAGEGEHPMSAEAADFARASMLVVGGRAAEALAVLRETGSASGIFQLNRDVTRALALLLEGRLEEALTASSRALELGRRQLRLGTIVAQSYVTAFALWASGRHVDLQRHLGTVLALESVPLLQEPYLAGLLNFAILDAASHEHFTYAHALEHQHRALSRRAGPSPGMNVSVGVDDGGATAGLLGSWWARLAPAIEPGTVIQDAVLAFWTALSGGACSRWPRSSPGTTSTCTRRCCASRPP